MVSGMSGLPPERAQGFVMQQLRPLLRWSGRLIPSCGSCGMPLEGPDDAGTEADGSQSDRYCTHCYRGGEFVEPDPTREEMIGQYGPLLAAELGMPLDRATANSPPIAAINEIFGPLRPPIPGGRTEMPLVDCITADVMTASPEERVAARRQANSMRKGGGVRTEGDSPPG